MRTKFLRLNLREISINMADQLELGVLAFQGAFVEHEECLSHAAKEAEQEGLLKGKEVKIRQVRTAQDIRGLHGLILPGGESTTMAKFLEKNNFSETINQWRQGNGHGKPVVWGTCAGLILLANKLQDAKTGGQFALGGIDVTATRNVYGRQTESFEVPLTLLDDDLKKGNSRYHGIFIRAPGIQSVDGEEVKILATTKDKEGKGDRVVAVRQGRTMATAFHPELTNDFRWHRYFLSMVLESVG